MSRNRKSVRDCVLQTVMALALAAMPGYLGAQTATLVGRLADSAGTAITHAVVHVDGTALNVLSDANGGFRVTQLPSGTHVVIARAFGFAPESLSVTATGGET